MENPILTLSSQQLIDLYENLVDIRPYLKGVKSISLHENEDGLMQWFPAVLGDGIFYEALSNKIAHYYPDRKTEYTEAVKLVSSSSRVLEIGCGEGFFGLLVNPNNWFGVDINKDALKKVSEKGLNCMQWDLDNNSIQDLPENEYDIVCSFQAIEHMSNPAKLFTVASSLIGEKGALIVGAPSHDSILGMHPLSPLNLPPHHQTWWTDKALRLFPLKFGFSCTDIIHCEVDSFHREWLMSTLLRSASLSSYTGMNPIKKKLFSKIRDKVIHYYMSTVFDKSRQFDPRFGLRGQSVIAVYQKTQAG